MKVADSELIRNSERELMDSITAELDWATIEKIFKDKHDLSLNDDIETRNGDLVVHEGEIAYRLDFDVRVTLTVLFDRAGNYVSLQAARPAEESTEPLPDEGPAARSSAERTDETDAEEAMAAGPESL